MGNTNSNGFYEQETHACCMQCTKAGVNSNIIFLSTYCYTRSSDNNKNIMAKVMYKCNRGHLFCTHELQVNYNSRVENHNILVNENLNLKTKIKELELVIENMKKSQVVASAPHIEVIATLLSDAIKN